MTPEKTNFITQGYDGLRRLKAGPMLDSYRGLNIIHSRQYSLETGAPPRDLLRRRTRVAEYYRIPWQSAIGEKGDNVMIDLYDESKDTFFTVSWQDLLQHAALDEADRLKFNNMDSQPEVVNQSVTSCMLDAGLNQDMEKDLIVVARPLKITNNIPDVADYQGGVVNSVAAAKAWLDGQQRYNGIADEAASGPGLVLVTNSITSRKSGRLQIPNDASRQVEYRSFYTASGLFNGTFNPAGLNLEEKLQETSIYSVVLLYNQLRVATVADPPGDNLRMEDFTHLMMGTVEGGPGAFVAQKNPNLGMRPNLHIGRMAYAELRPDTMRFKHVAAHIMAQTVVTRPLAVRLMQQAESAPPRDIRAGIMYVFGIDKATKWFTTEQRIPERRSYYNVETSVLAYMTAAVLSTQTSVRDHCRNALLQKGFNIEKIGESLVTWIKCFLNAIPLPQYGSESPIFDAYEQGRVLENTFSVFSEDPEMGADGYVNTEKRRKIPTMYLGEYIRHDTIQAAIAEIKPDPAGPDGVYQGIKLGMWNNNGTDLAMHRDVNEKTFTHRRCHVFPNGRKVVESKDVIAVTKTATAQDALISFVQIMSKRFFTSRPELYVETAQHDNANDTRDTRLCDKPNPEFADCYLGVTRRALTSNEYPVVFSGEVSMLKNPEKWEIVIVRPNIEHNMLAAVLGRGGIDELGATFWGQTELSCYVSFSGVSALGFG